MSRKALCVAFVVLLTFALVTVATAGAAPAPLSGKASRTSSECGLWWFDHDWEPIWIAGEGHLVEHANRSSRLVCRFSLDLTDPDLLSREQFCAEDWAAFMCRGNGALVDSHTTCNMDDGSVHNGTVVAAPNGEGTLVCHIK
ncbi:MAG: hypothetical protein ACYCYF_06040 [Anaerolineae bacterium]